MELNARALGYQKLNDAVRHTSEDVTINDCYGERFIGCGSSGKTITINGVPGNALGAYLDGSTIVVNGNAQDAVGDTMNNGSIIINGNAGDALGYAMRGGQIYVKGNSGHRTGIHMKQYKEKFPVIVVGGKSGSFLGEYLAGGFLILLGLDCDEFPVDNFTGTGMHGGEIYIRSDKMPPKLPPQVSIDKASDKDIEKIKPYIENYCSHFGSDMKEILSKTFYKLIPNAKNPYKKLYTQN